MLVCHEYKEIVVLRRTPNLCKSCEKRREDSRRRRRRTLKNSCENNKTIRRKELISNKGALLKLLEFACQVLIVRLGVSGVRVEYVVYTYVARRILFVTILDYSRFYIDCLKKVQ